jgi:predicted nucleic acid-binding protein
MKAVLLDTNVVLDVLLERVPHVVPSAALWTVIESGAAKGLLAAHALTTIHYLIRKERGTAHAARAINAMQRVFQVAPVDGAVIQAALRLPFADFEDAVTAAAADLANCDYIATRDPKGFRASPITPLAPELILPLLRPLK